MTIKKANKKTVEHVKCGTIECTCKPSMLELIIKFIKNIFKRGKK